MPSLEQIVALVEEGLDRFDRPGEDLAAAAMMSRFHFDRLASAALHEPVGALRRRVLLERAAWRLATTDLRIIDVALDAGYDSPDAFGRAFRRAFRISPSAFRASGRSAWTIAAGNHIHFHPPGGLRLPATERSTTINVLTRMIDHHLATTAAILDRLDVVQDRLDEPIVLSVEGIDRDPSLRSLADRLVGQLERWVTAVEGGTFVEPRASEPQALRARLADVEPRFRSSIVDEVAAGRGDVAFIDATCEPPQTFTLGGVVAHVLTFAAVRRTMAIGALESFGIDDLGSGDPMRAVGGEGEDASRIRRTTAPAG